MVSRRRTGRRAQQPTIVAEAVAPEAATEAPPALKPSEDEVLAAVQSLYLDQLRPSGRILRKRVAERASGLAMEDVYAAPSLLQAPLPEVDVAHLRAACEGCPMLQLEADEGGDWTAMLKEEQGEFVNVHSIEDVYPPELWTAADEYFESLQGPAMKLPGGRYACAQALLGRRLPFLEGRSLGQVCHIVQLAISEKKMLGYCNGTVVPYGHSQSMLKERCAEQQQPIGAEAAESATAMPLATWEVARRLLREILDEATQPGQGPAIVPLSNIKRLFRSRYRTELSETMLGHSRMADLMQDERFEDMCTLRLQKGGYVVVAKDASMTTKVSPASKTKTISLAATLQPQAQARPSDAIISLASQLRLDGHGENEEKSQAAGHQPQPLRLELCLERPVRWGDIEVEDEVALEEVWQGAAATVALPPKALPVLAMDESRGHLVETRLQQPEELEDLTPFASMAGQSLPTPLPSPGEPASATVRRWGASVRRTEFFPACEGRPAAGLRLPLAAREELPPQESQEEGPSPRILSCTPKSGGLGTWCPEEPLWLEDAGGSTTHRSLALPTPLASPGDPGSATLRRWAGLDGGAPRRLEFFSDDRPAELPAPSLPQNVLLGRTSPEKKSPVAGPDCHGNLKEAPRLLDVLPSPQRKTQALRSSVNPGGWQSLSQEFGHSGCQGFTSNIALPTPAAGSRTPAFPEESSSQACPAEPQHTADQSAQDSAGDGCLELMVRNTFLHSAPEPPLSPPGILRRSQSLPVSSLGAGVCQHLHFDETGTEEFEASAGESEETAGPPSAQDIGSGLTQKPAKSVVLLAECV